MRKKTVSIHEWLDILIESARNLRRTMLERNPRKIQEAVEEQEELMRSLPAPETIDTQTAPPQLRAKIQTLRCLHESNRVLAASFMRLYQTTFRHATGRVDNGLDVYGATGMMQQENSPLLVYQTG